MDAAVDGQEATGNEADEAGWQPHLAFSGYAHGGDLHQPVSWGAAALGRSWATRRRRFHCLGGSQLELSKHYIGKLDGGRGDQR